MSSRYLVRSFYAVFILLSACSVSKVTMLGKFAADAQGTSSRLSYLYAACDASIQMYTYDPDTNQFTALSTPSVSVGTGTQALTLHPNHKSLYATSGSSVYQYKIDSATGIVSPMTIPTVSAGNGPARVVVNPSGTFAYVTNFNSNDVYAFSIDPTTGALTATGSTAPAVGSGTLGLTIDPTGLFLYATAYFGTTVSQYTVDPITGTIAAQSTPTISGFNSQPIDGHVTFSLSNTYMYVPDNWSNGGIEQFRIDGTGSLVALATRNAPTTDNSNGMIIDTHDHYAYNLGASGNLDQFSIDPADGQLHALSPSSISSGKAGLNGGSLTPDGLHLFASHYQEGELTSYEVSPTTGKLTQNISFISPTCTHAQGLVFNKP